LGEFCAVLPIPTTIVIFSFGETLAWNWVSDLPEARQINLSNIIYPFFFGDYKSVKQAGLIVINGICLIFAEDTCLAFSRN